MKNRIFAVLITVFVLMISMAGCRGGKQSGVDSITVVGTESPSVVSSEGASGENSNIIATLNGLDCSSSFYKLSLYRFLISAAEEYGIPASKIADSDIADEGRTIKAGEAARRYAQEETLKYLVLKDRYRSLGLTPEQCPEWDGIYLRAVEEYKSNHEVYSMLGAGAEDIAMLDGFDALYLRLFILECSDGGSIVIPDEELENIMEQRIRRIRFTYLPFFDSDTFIDVSAEEKERLCRLSEDYLARIRRGEDSAEVIRENYLLLDGYGLRFSVENTDTYYSYYAPDIPEEIFTLAETLADGQADIITAEGYTSVVQRLPVNDVKDSLWRDTALKEAYYTEAGEGFDRSFNTAVESDKIIFDSETAEKISPASAAGLSS